MLAEMDALGAVLAGVFVGLVLCVIVWDVLGDHEPPDGCAM